MSEQPHMLEEWFSSVFGELYKRKYCPKEQVCTFMVSLMTAVCSQFPELYEYFPEVGSEEQLHQWESLVSILEEIGQKGREDFSVRGALRLCNLIFSHSLFRDEENDYYIYSIEQLVNTYGDFSEMLRQLQRFLEENAAAAESEQHFTNATFMKLMKYVNENYRNEISLTGAAQVLNMT